MLIVAPSLDMVGGHSSQADSLLQRYAQETCLEASLLPINPRIGPFRRFPIIRTLVNEFIYFLTLLARVWRYDVLHVFAAGLWSFLLAPVPAMLVGRLFGKYVILNYHDGRAPDHLAHWRTSRLVGLAHRIIVPSDFLVDVFARFGIATTAIYNVVEAEQFHFRERGQPQPKLLHNRGLDPVYNPETTVQAFALVQQRYPDASLTIAHEGPLRQSLENLVRKLELRNVQFIGRVSKERTPAVYDAADVYVMSPRFDNMPLSVLEAFASGVPLVSSNAGGVPYMVEHDRTGLLFPPGDTRAMADCILRVLEEDGLALRLTMNARNEVQRYTWERIRPQWLAAYGCNEIVV